MRLQRGFAPFDPLSRVDLEMKLKGIPQKPRREKVMPPVRWFPGELEEVKAAAARSGKTFSKFVRDELLGRVTPGQAPHKGPQAADVVELSRLVGQIGKLGGNLNQIAHVMNSGGDHIRTDQLEEVRAELREIKAAVLKALGR